MIKAGKIQKKIMESQFVLPIVIILCVVTWIAHFAAYPTRVTSVESYVVIKQWNVAHIPYLIQFISSILIYVLNGYLLIDLNNRSDILRIRPTVLIAVYFLFLAVYPDFYIFTFSNLSVISFILSLYFLFDSYQIHDSSIHLFYTFLFLSIGSLFFPQLIFIIPIFFIGAGMMQSLNIRSFFAALTGFALPYFVLLAYALYMDHIGIFYAPFMEIFQFGKMNIFTQLDTNRIIVLAFFLFIYVISIIHCMIIDYDNIIRARTTLHFIILLNTCIMIFVLLQPQHATLLLSLSLPGLSLVVCHFFKRSDSRPAGILFIISLLATLILYTITFFS